MIIKTRIFELDCRHHKNLSDLAQAMGLSVSQVYRVRQGKRPINQKFIIGAMKAFPQYKLDDLFYFAPAPPVESTRQALEKFTTAGMPSTPRATLVPF
jgi:transcriptional regulator with XRE-family HTH domain